MPDQAERIDIGDLAENVTRAVQRALQAQTAGTPRPFGRIVIGIIFEPPAVEAPKGA